MYMCFLHTVNLCLARHLQLEAILATHSQQPVQLPTPERSSMVGLLMKHVEDCLVCVSTRPLTNTVLQCAQNPCAYTCESAAGPVAYKCGGRAPCQSRLGALLRCCS